MGGGSDVNSVDKEYNARMATIAEKQNEWAENYYNMWDTHFKKYEIEQAKTNFENLPLENGLYKEQLTTLRDLIPKEKELYTKQLETTNRFLDASTKGVDINERMGMATADVAGAWKNANEANIRANARMGVNPNSGRFMGTQAAMQTQQAAQMAGARTQARVGAEQENYDRLMKATAVRQEPSTLLKGMGFLGNS